MEEDLTTNQHMDSSRAPEPKGFAESSPTENWTWVRVDVELERPLLVSQEPTTRMPLWPGRWAKRASLRRKDATAKRNWSKRQAVELTQTT